MFTPIERSLGTSSPIVKAVEPLLLVSWPKKETSFSPFSCISEPTNQRYRAVKTQFVSSLFSQNHLIRRPDHPDFSRGLEIYQVSQVTLVVKNPPASGRDVRDVGSIPEWGRSPGEGHGTPLQYSCLENSMDRGAWWTTVHEVTRVRHD